ncbi:MAG: threonine--tRNA ligase [Candidatus Nomurabacteria bacterium]
MSQKEAPNQLFKVRHSLAHVLLMAIKHNFPHALPTIGPVTDTGFYYDLDFAPGVKIGVDDLKKVEDTMREILKRNLDFKVETVSTDQARTLFAVNPFKLELIDGIEKEGQDVTLYHTGEDFYDLCEGPHVENTKEIPTNCFILSHLAGAYWRGDETKPMLTRIYGLAFETKEELDAYILQQEEAKKRDHRIIGAQLKLFTVSPLIGAGLPLMQPNGMIIRKEIEDYLWSLHSKKGYSRVWTPHIAKEALYVTSGHAAKFGDELFRVQGKEDKFIMKPMNCPHHMQIFADNQFSYRDMPVRYFEPATVYRDEKSGQLGGLLRVRAITQDDGHLFCTQDQVKQEVSTIVGIIKEFYTTMGMMDGYWVSWSVRGTDKSKYLGTDEVWDLAESSLEEAAKANGLNYRRVEGEAAFYGPKLDFMFKDAIGREWQLATIQCDFNLPERFDLNFINAEGKKERPVVIHRAISGSIERFMGVMIEHFAGNFPLWLSPNQITILPIADKHAEYANTVFEKLQNSDIRVKIDNSREGLGKKIRNTREMKTPYWAVIGDAEITNGTVTLEHRVDGKIGEMKIEDLIIKLSEEIKGKK